MSAIDELIEVMARLRDPESGCPWDLEQTFSTIAPYTVEEAYEVADAIARGDMDELVDELGDLLFQVVFHARMAEEQGDFRFEDVVRAIVDKMVRRHPHVFASESVPDAAAQSVAWEAIKAAERAERGNGASESILDTIGSGLPALRRAAALQRKAARVGFDWPGAAAVLPKVEEELREVRAALEPGGGDPGVELGDLLFTCVNLSRHLDIDPDMALRGACERFERRFRRVEQHLGAGGEPVEEAGLERLDTLWESVKREEGGGC